jgi:Holliday junction resolvase
MSDVIPLESAVVERIKKLLKKRGCYFIKTTGVREAGTPDILACYKGRFIAIEVKRPEIGRVTPIQRRKLDLVTKAGGIAMVATDEAEVGRMLNLIAAGM